MTQTAARPDQSPDPGTAIAAARARTRRAWRFQLIGMLVVTLVVGTGVWLVWRHSEIRAVHLHSTSIAPKPLAGGAIRTGLAPAWKTTDRAASGTPVYEDIAVTYSERTVSGRDAITGRVRWSYTRTDRKICAVTVQDAAVVAVYAHDGLCDEVTGLDAGSGQRIWVRTLLSSGTPSTFTMSSRSSNVLIVTPDAVELIEPTGGLDWWFDQQPAGCVTESAVLGTGGVLMANRCGLTTTLSLRALGSAQKRTWTVPQAGRAPLSSDTLITALSSDGRSIAVLNPATGAATLSIALRSAVQPATAPLATPLSDPAIEAVSVRDASIGFQSGSRPTLLWQRSGAGLPVSIDQGLLAVTPTGAALLDPQNGAALIAYRISGVPATDIVNQLGRGLLVSGTAGTAAYL